jgi:hypothetical protein
VFKFALIFLGPFPFSNEELTYSIASHNTSVLEENLLFSLCGACMHGSICMHLLEKLSSKIRHVPTSNLCVVVMLTPCGYVQSNFSRNIDIFLLYNAIILMVVELRKKSMLNSLASC